MKVLAFTPQYLPMLGGIEILLDLLAAEFRKHGIETVVIADFDASRRLPQRDVVNGTPVYRLDFTRAIRAQDAASPLRILQQLAGVVDAEEPDVIHVHWAAQFSAWYLQRLLKKSARRPALIVTQHGVMEPIDRLAVVRELLLEADMLTAVSEAALQSALDFSNRAGPSQVIYNGLPAPAEISAISRSGRAALACVGRLEPEKGFDLAIVALAKLRDRGVDAELTIIGQGHELKPLKALTLECKVAEYVRFLGMIDHPAALEAISRSTLLLIPSRAREGFSLVAAEAALRAVPCVAARMAGLPEVVEDGVTGLIVPPDDAEALANAVAALVKDEQRLEAMGRNARRRALAEFGLEACVGQYLRLYRHLTAPRDQSTIIARIGDNEVAPAFEPGAGRV